MGDKDFKSMAVCVDFDGVLAEFSDHIEDLGEPIEGGAEALKQLKNMGYKIIIHTARPHHDEHLQKIEDYLNEHGIPFDEINKNSDCPWESTKPLADLYIDDRGLRFEGCWDTALKKAIEILRMTEFEKRITGGDEEAEAIVTGTPEQIKAMLPKATEGESEKNAGNSE